MSSSLKNDAERSKKFLDDFLPLLMEKTGCSFASTENHSNPIEGWLDRDCSVDGVIGKPNGDYTEYFPFSSRVIEVKPGGRDYDGFSVRYVRASGNPTEAQKLLDVTKPRPILNIQSFVDNVTGTATVAIVKTVDLLNYIKINAPKIITSYDGTKFNFAKWLDLLEAGIKVAVYRICAATGEVTKLSVEDLKGAN